MNKFETFWNDLSIQLKTNKKIKNWTIKKGNFGEDFTAQIKNNNSIMITTLKGSEQSVSRKDFQLIYDDWDGYVNERIKRISSARSRNFCKTYKRSKFR